MSNSALKPSSKFVRLCLAVLVILGGTILSGGSASAAPGDIVRLSASTEGVEGNAASTAPSMSADGRFVVFESDASNLVPNDTNGQRDIFLRDQLTGTTELVSISTDGIHGNAISLDPSISADGRYISFTSSSTNLAPGQDNAAGSIFVRDRVLGITTYVPTPQPEAGLPSVRPGNSTISADGRYIAFEAAVRKLVSTIVRDIFLYDTVTGINKPVSISNEGLPGNNNSIAPSISTNGRYVAFSSNASNLVPEDTDEFYNIFVRDTILETTTLVSVVTDTFIRNGSSIHPSISGDGRFIAFSSFTDCIPGSDTNEGVDVFVRDMLQGVISCISTTAAGETPYGGWSGDPSISADGRYVVFESDAVDVVNDPTGRNYQSNIIMHDRVLGKSVLVSPAGDGSRADSNSYVSAWPELDTHSISADGRFVTFTSDSSNLVSGDTNRDFDVFLKEVDWSRGYATSTPSFTPEPTSTNTPTITFMPTETPTPTLTATPTDTPTFTSTPTDTSTPTLTFTPTNTLTATSTPTSTPLPFVFQGFFQPVDNLPTLNVVKAGSAIPVKFNLGGNQGLDIFATGYPTSTAVACGTTAEDAIEQTVTAGASGLTYNVSTDQYTYVWKTDKAWAGTCRTLVVKLNDGTYHRASFKFK